MQLDVNGQQVEVPDRGQSLLEVLRDELGLRSPKDGCSPQGQCGCCTVMVDGQPRVACVTPARRVAGRSIETAEHLSSAEAWADALCATGGSQCGFCTPGIVVRLAGLHDKKGELTEQGVRDALKAHVCRCTGWQTIVEAAAMVADGTPVDLSGRDFDAAARRAELEGGVAQVVGPQVALGQGGFADDTAPVDAVVAVEGDEGWAFGGSVSEARTAAGKVQGRRTTIDATPPLTVPEGEWAASLRTPWVEPAYLETDASWAQPDGEAASPLGNAGAFGGKLDSPIAAKAAELATSEGRAVRALWSREDTVRQGPKRPPFAGGANPDGTGQVVVVRTPGIADAITAVAPGLTVTEVDVPGPPTSAQLRAAGWAEAVVLLAGARGEVGTVTAPDGGSAEATVGDEGIAVTVRCGEILDEVTLRSYCIGAAHMAYSWVTSEALSVDDNGEVHDLTIRSFGIVRAVDTPPISITIQPGEGTAVNGSDAVFAAVAAATWLAQDCPRDWPTNP